MSNLNGKEKTVLVVEKNPDDTYLLHLAAKEMCPDISFVFVPDGAEALAYLKGEGPLQRGSTQGLPDLMVVDARLIGMDGYTVVEQTREDPKLRELKILLWTDGLEPDFRERAQEAGADLFIRKPVNFPELLDEVQRICELARVND